jgi:DNA-binding LacI/PurR family transcriptional regulator
VTARLRDLDVAIPDDLSVVVFRDAAWTALAKPAFTVVRHPVGEIADTAVRLLNQRLTADPRHCGSTCGSLANSSRVGASRP